MQAPDESKLDFGANLVCFVGSTSIAFVLGSYLTIFLPFLIIGIFLFLRLKRNELPLRRKGMLICFSLGSFLSCTVIYALLFMLSFTG